MQISSHVELEWRLYVGITFSSSAEIPCLAELTTPTTAIMNSARRENIFFNFFALRDTAACSVIAVIDTINTDLAFMAPRDPGENFHPQLRNFLGKFVALIIKEFALSWNFSMPVWSKTGFFLAKNRLFLCKRWHESSSFCLSKFDLEILKTESIALCFDFEMCISCLWQNTQTASNEKFTKRIHHAFVEHRLTSICLLIAFSGSHTTFH